MMATNLDPPELSAPQTDFEEQRVRIRLAIEESEKFSAETRRIVADMLKTQAKTKIMPWTTIFQAMLATAALLGAGATIARLLIH